MMDDYTGILALPEQTQRQLLEQALEGNRHALEQLVKAHQPWIYNVALRMVWYPPDAEDVTQEVLIKMITNLGTFRGESSIRTWLYRILVNHVMKMRKQSAEKNWYVKSFDEYGRSLDGVTDLDMRSDGSLSVDAGLLVSETRLKCKMGMLLCLNRALRIAFILGAIFGVSDGDAAEILAISPENFRQRLSRARRKIRSFLDERCELVDRDNPCKCHRKTRALMELGNIDPERLLFSRPHLKSVGEIIRDRTTEMGVFDDVRVDHLFREDPFQETPDFVETLQSIVDDSFYGRFE